MSTFRFTRDGDDALEALLETTCREIGAEVAKIVPADKLQALALGGGYGRGEGGVLKTASGDAPYNDLEFFLLIDGPPRLNEQRFGHAIHDYCHRMTEQLGIEVEIKITSLDAIANGPTSMFYYDLVEGHRIFAGPDDALASCRHHADASRIPPHEATRLLMNRCSGLLYAKQRLAKKDFTREDADFVARNIAKAQLAMGDALLAAHGRYHWSCLERHQRLQRTDATPELLAFHRDGVEFKLHPVSTTAARDELAALHAKVTAAAWSVWRQVEEKRLAKPFRTPADYAHDGNKCPETNALKNALIRLRTFGPKGLLARPFRYPREALLNSLPVLLWDSADADPRWLSRQLVASVATPADAIPAYQRLWERYN
ncbi:hypothetical protein [Haloferula sargassicola]|uniref:Uncharacterized protein n=1 Tax=Haloferula sargassicola TaxID=490096 RepID=A0ABP9UK90_9BACT